MTVVCGKGNNGGDGLVVARLLREAGREVAVLCAAPPEELQRRRAREPRAPAGRGPLRLDGRPWADGRGAPARPFERPCAIVDALLGTGFAGAPRGRGRRGDRGDRTRRARPVVSVDVPSGVDASTGVVAGAAVRAAAPSPSTPPSPGSGSTPARQHAGEVEVAGHRHPPRGAGAADVGLIDAAVLARLPRRGAGSTKFVSGHVLVAGGSRRADRRAAMASRAAMRAGAGYVTACRARRRCSRSSPAAACPR